MLDDEEEAIVRRKVMTKEGSKGLLACLRGKGRWVPGTDGGLEVRPLRLLLLLIM